METTKQLMRSGDRIIRMTDNGKYKIMRPFTEQIPEELIINVLLKIS